MANHRREKQVALRRELTIRTVVSKRGWLLRQLRLTGDVEATIEYNARGLIIGPGSEIEGAPPGGNAGVVKVNGIVFASLRKRPAGGDAAHFSINSPNGEVRVSVRASLDFGFVPRICALTVAVAGVSVYEEVAGRIIKPTHDDAHLPLPSEPEREANESLPLLAHETAPDNHDQLPIPHAHVKGGDRRRGV